MAYEINKTTGTKLDDLGDNELLVIGDSANGITLFGKNTSNYGEQLNENFLRLLENFAKPTEPTTPVGQSPIVGQLWWDTTNNVLKIRADSANWKAVGTPLVSENQPSNPKDGELWYDNSAASKQLKIYSGGSWQIVGPQSLNNKGASGISVQTVAVAGGPPIIYKTVVTITVGSDDVVVFTNEEINLAVDQLPEFPRILRPGLNLRANTESGGITFGLLKINSSGILPDNNAAQDIGSNTFKFNNVYATTLYGNGANVTNVAASTAVNSTNATNASNINVTTTGNADVAIKYPIYVNATSGNQAVQVDTEFTYTPNAGGDGNPGLLKAPKMEATVFESKAVSPNPPFIVASNTLVDNLHAATADKWHTARTLTFTGAITSTATLDGSGNVSIATTVGSISIGATSITGTWVSNVANGTGVSISGTAGSGWTPTISIGQAVATNSNVQFNSIGIGTAAAGTAGEIRATGDIIGFYSSDISLKENIFPIENPLKKLGEITGVTFDWTNEYIQSRGGEDGYFVRKKDVGVIAQEIEKVFPELVAKRENGKLAVKYDRLVSLLIEAVKELNAKVQDLEKKVR